MIIAIDGPSAVGKGTLARRLADTLNLAHLDTGCLYRGVALSLRDEFGERDYSADEAENASKTLPFDEFTDPRLRDEKTASVAAKVAAMPKVRHALLARQRNFAMHPPKSFNGAILDGRDIGTVILPDADIKFFCTAAPEERAQRRYNELQSKKDKSSLQEILDGIIARDKLDMERVHAPLIPAEGVITIDTTNLSVDAMVAKALEYIRQT